MTIEASTWLSFPPEIGSASPLVFREQVQCSFRLVPPNLETGNVATVHRNVAGQSVFRNTTGTLTRSATGCPLTVAASKEIRITMDVASRSNGSPTPYFTFASTASPASLTCTSTTTRFSAIESLNPSG